MMKIAGSGSEYGSISQRHGSADLDPLQNVMDPQHCSCIVGGGRRGNLSYRTNCHFNSKFSSYQNTNDLNILEKKHKVQ
jgi:hypothetical protein